MSDQNLEPFPQVLPPSHAAKSRAGAPRPRRKSSNLGGEPRGDTGAAALATLSPNNAAAAVSLLMIPPSPIVVHVNTYPRLPGRIVPVGVRSSTPPAVKTSQGSITPPPLRAPLSPTHVAQPVDTCSCGARSLRHQSLYLESILQLYLSILPPPSIGQGCRNLCPRAVRQGQGRLCLCCLLRHCPQFRP